MFNLHTSQQQKVTSDIINKHVATLAFHIFFKTITPLSETIDAVSFI